MNRASSVNILDRPLGGRSRSSQTEVSLSSFCYLYSELVQYHQNRVDSISELERKLESSGYGVGFKVLELLAYRNKEFKREIRLMNVLQFVSTQCWKALFNKPADSLEKSIDHQDEYMIIDYTPITSTFIRINSENFGQLSVDSYISGIIAGVLQGAGFSARVTAHSVALEEHEINELKQLNSATGSAYPSNQYGSSSMAPHHSQSGTSASSAASSYLSASNFVGAGGSSNTSTSSSGNYPSSDTMLPPRTEKTVFLVKFNNEILQRDASMDR